MDVWYTTRNAVKTALDEMETARSNAQIDAAIAQGARDVEGLCDRGTGPFAPFAPIYGTAYADFPRRGERGRVWRIRLQNTLISLDAATTNNGATVIDVDNDVFPEPVNSGPPFRSLEINLDSSASWSSADTFQRAIAMTGLWGWTNDRETIGALSGSLAGSVSATASMAWNTARFGVGDLLFIDSEAMIITEQTYVDSGQNLGAGLLAESSDVQLTVSDGTGFATDELISVEGERMRVEAITGNVLSVRRAEDGSQLAAHANGADIYALTGVQLARAQAGTTIAAHSAAAEVERWIVPPLLGALNRAYAINNLLQDRAGWARVAGTGEQAREFTGRGIAQLEADVRRVFGPGEGARHRAIV